MNSKNVLLSAVLMASSGLALGQLARVISAAFSVGRFRKSHAGQGDVAGIPRAPSIV